MNDYILFESEPPETTHEELKTELLEQWVPYFEKMGQKRLPSGSTINQEAKTLTDDITALLKQRGQNRKDFYFPPRINSPKGRIIIELIDKGRHKAARAILKPFFIQTTFSDQNKFREQCENIETAIDISTAIYDLQTVNDQIREPITKWQKEIESIRETSQVELNEIISIKKNAVQDVTLYAPLELWNKRASKALYLKIFNFTIFIIVMTSGIFSGYKGILWTQNNTLSFLTYICQQNPEGIYECRWMPDTDMWAILLTTSLVLGLFIWLLKIFHKNYRKQDEDLRFYQDKIAYTEALRSHEQNGKLDPTDRKIIIEAIFRTRETNQQSDEHTNIVQSIVGGLKE